MDVALAMNHCAQISTLMSGVAGAKWLRERREHLSEENGLAYAEANALRPISAVPSLLKNNTKPPQSQETEATASQTPQKRGRRRWDEDDDEDESCCRCLCKYTICCIPWCFCPKCERATTRCSTRVALKIAKWVLIIVAVIWILTGINYLITGEKDLTQRIDAVRGLFGYPPLNSTLASVLSPISVPIEDVDAPPPPPSHRVNLSAPDRKEL
jgi:hypothetical protein